jgi:hypothetical protein
MQLTPSDIVNLQSIIQGAQDLLAANEAGPIAEDLLVGVLYSMSCTTVELCIENDVTPATDVF